jgi:hypothetical protein
MSVLTPHLALAYLRELSTDIRGAVVLDQEGMVVAGDEELGEPARRLIGAIEAKAVEVRLGGPFIFGVRGTRFSLAVVATRFALSSLMLYDLRKTLEDLERS